ATPRERPEHGPGPLPWRVTARPSFTVDAACFPDSAGHTLEIYVRLPPATLAELVTDTLGTLRLRLSARTRSSYGAAQHDAAQVFSLARDEAPEGLGKVVLFAFPVRPGKLKLQVKLEDLQAKRGFAYLGRP